jgi:hypothetical protein
MAYDPCAPNIPAAPAGAPIHHHYVHRIVGRVRPRARAPIHKIAAQPLNPDGCARGTGGALNTPRPATIGAGGLGAGKIASIVGAGGAAIGGSLIPPGGSITPGGGTTGTTTTPVAVSTPPSDPGTPTGPITTGTTPPIIVPPVPPVVVVPGGGTTPVSVPEPTTLVIFAMALAALWLARTIALRRGPSAI